jgi:hypothetical protein
MSLVADATWVCPLTDRHITERKENPIIDKVLISGFIR